MSGLKKPVRLERVPIPERSLVEAEKKRLDYRERFYRTLWSTISILLVTAACAILISTLFLPILQVSGTSMEPTLENGDVILLFKSRAFQTGDLVGLHYDGKILLKRVIAGPGDYVDIDEEGTVSVNGTVIDEPYILEKSRGDCDITFPYQVPDESYFVLGDHRSVSVDSRSSAIGCIPYEQIIGRIIARILPINTISMIT